MEPDDASSTSSCVYDNAVKEIRSFHKFCHTQSFAMKPHFLRQSSSQGLLQSIQKNNLRSAPYSQLFSFSRDSESSVATSSVYLSRQVSHTHEFSTGYLDFLNKTTESLYTSVWIKITMWLLAAFLVAVFFIGNHYINDCPEITELPVYLSVGGATGFLKIVLIFLRRRDIARKDEEKRVPDMVTDIVLQRYVRYTDNLLTLFLPVWFILGNHWYFSKPTPNFVPILYEPTHWCDEILYEWVFYKLVFSYIFFSVMLIYVVLLTVVYFSLGASVLLKSGFIG